MACMSIEDVQRGSFEAQAADPVSTLATCFLWGLFCFLSVLLGWLLVFPPKRLQNKAIPSLSKTIKMILVSISPSNVTKGWNFIKAESLIGEGNGNPLQHSCLGNPMDRGAWWITAHRVTKSRSRFSNQTTATAKSLIPQWRKEGKVGILVNNCPGQESSVPTPEALLKDHSLSNACFLF